jgi:NADH dehydrogenase [ubiquinone] 1 alpha subcomplex assembly factor 5
LKKRQRQWSISIPNSEHYDYLRQEIAERLVDRLDDISRDFEVALDIGCHKGFILNSIAAKNWDGGRGVGGIKRLHQCDIADFSKELEKIVISKDSAIEHSFVVADEESNNFPFEDNSVNLVMTAMSLHWVNDIPSTLMRIKKILKPDGAFICSMLGGSTLEELRHCFYLAEMERKGGLSPHTSPYVRPSDAAALLQGAGFALPTIDVDTIKVLLLSFIHAIVYLLSWIIHRWDILMPLY